MDKCPVCGSAMGNDAKACMVCGTEFNSTDLYCQVCNSHVKESATKCLECGTDLTHLPPKPEGIVEEITEEDAESIEVPSEEVKGAAEEIATIVVVDVELEELVRLSAIGPLRAKILFDAGFTDLRKLKQASVVELMNIRGIGRKAAGEIKSALREHTLEDLRALELTEENVGSEYQCQLCGTVVSAYESSCYECGCIFKPDELADGDSDRLALSYYDSKLLRTPENKDLWYARGATLVKMENYEHALSSFNKAIEIDPSYQTAWMSKADVYNKLGDSAKAAECYSHIITSASGGQIPGSEDEYEPIPQTYLDDDTDDLELKVPEPLPEPEMAPAIEEEIIEEDTIPEITDLNLEEETASTSMKMAEPDLSVQPTPEPEIIKPETTDEFSELAMDYEKQQSEKPNYGTMTDAELKKELSKRASHVKPYLSLAKNMNVDINHAKKLVSRAVTESKQGELKIAIQLMDEGIEFAEAEFNRKIMGDIDNLASVLRDLKSTGKDVTSAVDLITTSKELLESGDIANSVQTLRKCLEVTEQIAST
ncbi:MAG: tetratricopeptide repeat protein [Thermoplasmata archaeon]|nr:tetratricopeptide repeat protein [Thermoplasmata archaeon]